MKEVCAGVLHLPEVEGLFTGVYSPRTATRLLKDLPDGGGVTHSTVRYMFVWIAWLLPAVNAFMWDRSIQV